MIPLAELQESAAEWGLPLTTVERDYALGWVLWGIGSQPEIMDRWGFKGGTCLKKCYMETWRFSEDVDFTLLPGSSIDATHLQSVITAMQRRITEQSGIDFSPQPAAFRVRPDGASVEGKIYFRSLTGMSHAPLSVKLDLTTDEPLVTDPVRRKIQHVYSDTLPGTAQILCYSFAELFSEKIRAMGQRARPRDLYDIINLFWRQDAKPHRENICNVLARKCNTKGIALVTYETISLSPHLDELQSEWSNMLSHQLKELPPFDHFWSALPEFFVWLHGHVAEVAAPHARTKVAINASWVPPAAVSHWGGAPIEVIRFAASNRLCVQLGYEKRTRLIEPYALKQTQEGNIILVARKVETGETRSYRIDRIESATATRTPFTPVFAIEMTTSSPIPAPFILREKHTRPRIRRLSTVPKARSVRKTYRARARSFGPTYIIECSMCRKRLPKKKLDTTLGPHKMKGQDFPCSGRRGWHVDTKWS